MKRNTIALLAALIISLTAAGCSSSENSNSVTAVSNSASAQAQAAAGNTAGSTTSAADSSELFTNRDLKQEADLSEAKQLTVSDNSTIDITEAGVYVISGSASNCTVKVNASSEDKVQLVLDGVTVTNSDFPVIYVVSADKCFITTTEGSTNELSVTGSFTADGDTNTDAVIFSKDDLVLNGLGSLTVSSASGNGITGKDDVKFTGGSYTIVSALDSIEANDTLAVCGGDFTITSSKDALHCENSDDSSQGVIYISGGSFEINSKSDGIQGTASVTIDGGTFNITAAEGIEATAITINDGSITITASDDGINAANKSTAYSPNVIINGGSINISMGQGDTDAIDANGSIYVNGGTINITAPTSSFDYDQTAEFNGGTIIINGQEVSEIPQSMMGGGMRGGNGTREDKRNNRGNWF